MELSEQFEQAVALSKTLPAKPSNDILLKIYALYKQAKEGDAGSDESIGAFDFVGRAKHTAWSELMGKTTADAMQEYIEIIARLKS